MVRIPHATHLLISLGLCTAGATSAPAQGLPTIPVFDTPEESAQAPATPVTTPPATPPEDAPPATTTTAATPATPPAEAPTSAAPSPAAPPPATAPSWEAEFEQLPAETRSQYIMEMRRAKDLYQKGDTELCLLALGSCELLFSNNPHALNLQISCLLDLNRLDEIPALISKSKELLPDNEVAVFSESNLLLAQGRYDACIAVSQHMLTSPLYKLTPLVRDILKYRILLSLLAMNRPDQAREQVKGLTPISDTPLYYMSEAAFNLVEGQLNEANRALNAAQTIFGSSGTLVGFVRAFNQSQLADKSHAAATE